MICRHTETYFDDYIEGKLNPQDKTRLEEHLRDCSECREYVEQEKELMQLLKTVPLADPGEAYWQHLENSIFTRTISQPEVETGKSEYIFAHPIKAMRRYILPVAAVIILLIISLALVESHFSSWPLSARWQNQKAYNATLIGNYNTTILIEQPRSEIESDLLGSLILSAPGSAIHNLAVLEQLSNLKPEAN